MARDDAKGRETLVRIRELADNYGTLTGASLLMFVKRPEWDSAAATTAAGLVALLGLLAWAAWLYMRKVVRRRRSAPPRSAE